MSTTHRAELPLSLFTNWLASGERGLSSEAIVAHLTGKRVGSHGRGDHPYDADDFRRCVLVLEHVSIARLTLHRMADVSPEWAALVSEWDSLEQQLRNELDDDLSRHSRKPAPKTSARIREILRTVRDAR